MSDALAGFAQGFASTFVPTYQARLAADEKEKTDKIRLGASAWLKKEEAYNAAKASDQAIMDQAQALADSESLIPNDAVVDVFNMLKSGRTVKMIVDDVRSAGSSFEKIPEPDPSLINQTDTILTEKKEEPAAIPIKKPEPDLNNPFTKYSSQIQEMVGQSESPDYFDQVLSGYNPEKKVSKYKFIPGVTKTDVKSLEQMLVANITSSEEYKNASPEEQQKIILKAYADKKGDGTSGLNFGTGGVGASMSVWASTDEGKLAIKSGDAIAIANQVKKLQDIITPPTTDKEDAFDFDLADPHGSFFNMWERSADGKKAIAEGDFDKINEANAAALENAEKFRGAINQSVGFDPTTVTQIDMLPGLRQKHKDSPVILEQLASIEEGLKSAAKAVAEITSTPKMYTVFGTGTNGAVSVIGTGEVRNGKLTIGGEEVSAQDAATMFLASTDAQLDIAKIGANSHMKKRDQLYGSIDFASSALTYLATLEQQELGRTTVARLSSGAGELLSEIQALKSLSTIINAEGEEVIDRTKLLNQINTHSSLSKFSAEVRSIMAQETSLIFDIARAEGNSGTALSNKDYDNYFKSIFNSNELEVIRVNIERKVGQSVRAAFAGARSIAQNPNMQYLTNGNSTQWWESPKETALEGRTDTEIKFVEKSLALISEIQDQSSYGTGPKPTAEEIRKELIRRGLIGDSD
jgi:hypothetical protein